VKLETGFYWQCGGGMGGIATPSRIKVGNMECPPIITGVEPVIQAT
jgi:hypothetical protein